MANSGLDIDVPTLARLLRRCATMREGLGRAGLNDPDTAARRRATDLDRRGAYAAATFGRALRRRGAERAARLPRCTSPAAGADSSAHARHATPYAVEGAVQRTLGDLRSSLDVAGLSDDARLLIAFEYHRLAAGARL